MSIPMALHKHFRISEDRPFVTTFLAHDPPLGMAGLQRLMQEHRSSFQHLMDTRGVVVVRGLTPDTPEHFQTAMAQGLGIEPWNGFNLKGLPGFAGNWLRRYTEGLMGSGDYRRFVNKHTVQLGPVANSVQGPHVEGGGSPRRARYLALCCFEPSEHQAETGLVDLSAAMMHLRSATRQKYLQACNTFYYITARPLTWLDRLILSQSPITVMEEMPDGRAKLRSPPTPAVCLHPVTREECLQPWGFARNTNGHALASAEQAFPSRAPLERCPNADGTHYLWGLCDALGQSLPWSDEEQRELFDTLYQHAFLMDWRKGDIALVDNVRVGHWRMNGIQGQRKLLQVQLGSVNALEMMPEELDGTVLMPSGGRQMGGRKAA